MEDEIKNKNTDFNDNNETSDDEIFKLDEEEKSLLIELDSIKNKLSPIFDDVLDSTIYTNKKVKVPIVKSLQVFSKNINYPFIIKATDFIPKYINEDDYILIEQAESKEHDFDAVKNMLSIKYVTMVEEGNYPFINRIFGEALKKIQESKKTILDVLTEDEQKELLRVLKTKYEANK